MSTWKGQSGRGGIGLLVVIVLLAVAGYLAWGFAHQTPGPRVAATQADTANANEKALAFANAQAQAQRTGRPVQVVETFNDSELSSLANEAAQQKGLPVDQISLHATGQGTVQGQAQAHMGGQTVPVSIEGVPIVTDNRVALNVTNSHLGSIPLPGPVSDELTRSIRQPLELGQPVSGFENLHVAVSDGQLTVSGVAQPA